MNPTVASAMRWGLAELWRTSGRVKSDRVLLYGGQSGLRILTFHETLGEDLRRFQRVVEWCRSRFPMATPADADEVAAGRWPHEEDRVLLTFDDGWESNFEAARWLATMGVSAVFFVVPSLLGRDAGEYRRFHGQNHLAPGVPEGSPGARGLSRAQLRDMRTMGHRIAAHNYAHRDLSLLRSPSELRFEIDQALEALGEILGAPCHDFAIAYGMPHNLSEEAIAHLKGLQARGVRIYSCHRGLNVPGRTPSFLLRHAWERFHPMNFTRLCIEGGADRRLGTLVRQMTDRVGALPVADGLPT
jgi:peptidoglycan/xylan/chitin deacetylase (PgdA/CDA1 family)